MVDGGAHRQAANQSNAFKSANQQPANRSKVLTSSSSDEEPMFEKAYSVDTPLDDRGTPMAAHAYVQANKERANRSGSK